MTRFTTPEELFGPVSVQGLKADQYRRVTAGKLPEAPLAVLDEIFKANSAILNALLTLMNERQFDNGGQRVSVPLISLFGASNPGGVLDALAQLRKDLAGKGIIASDRRWLWMLHLLRAQALLEGRGVVEEDDLIILRDALWNTPEQRQEIGRLAARRANPLNAKAVELGDQAASVHQAALSTQNGSLDDEAKMKAAVEANTKLKAIRAQLARLVEQAQAQGRSTGRIEKVQAQVRTMHEEVAGLIL
jgi:MoxR-like ATPase